MKNITLLILALLFLIYAEAKKPDKAIVGTWSMFKVYEYDHDVTAKHNPENNRWVDFKPDGIFVSDGDPFGRNTSRWKVDNKNSLLFIDSDVDDDDSEWKVSIKGDEMIWTGIGHPRKENTKLVHKRKN